MTLGVLIESYVDVLLRLVDLDHVFGAVDALVHRDAASRWFETEN